MHYADDIPEATLHNLAESLASSNPRGFAEERLAELNAIMRKVDAERAKWVGVIETSKLFPDASTETTEPAPSESPASAEGSSARVLEARNGKRHYKSLREYPALIRKLFDEQSRRIWRTAELTGELINRGWVDGSEREESNRVTRALRTLVDEGEIVSVKKGQYVRRSPITDYEHAGRIGLSVPDHLPAANIIERDPGEP